VYSIMKNGGLSSLTTLCSFLEDHLISENQLLYSLGDELSQTTA